MQEVLSRLIKLAPLLKTSPIMASTMGGGDGVGGGGGGVGSGVDVITAASDLMWRVPTDYTATDETKLVSESNGIGWHTVERVTFLHSLLFYMRGYHKHVWRLLVRACLLASLHSRSLTRVSCPAFSLPSSPLPAGCKTKGVL